MCRILRQHNQTEKERFYAYLAKENKFNEIPIKAASKDRED